MKAFPLIALLCAALVAWQIRATSRVVDRQTSQVADGGIGAAPALWETYTNDAHGLSVPYPADWTAVEGGTQTGIDLASVSFRPQFPAPADSTFGLVRLSIVKDDEDLAAFIESHLCEAPGVCASSRDAARLIVAGVPALRVHNPPFPTSSDVVVFKKGGNTYAVTLIMDRSYEEQYSLEQKREIFDDVLSHLTVAE